MATAAKTHTPNPVDLYVGSRVRLRRKLMRLSQMALAAHLGITFQQVQKYESGHNRVSASMLHAIAHVLKVPVNWFFEGLDTSAAAPEATGESAPALPSRKLSGYSSRAIAESLELIELFSRIKSENYRTHILGLVKAMAVVKD
jgi:transcriptional regulator with XRE-family HTH domain